MAELGWIAHLEGDHAAAHRELTRAHAMLRPLQNSEALIRTDLRRGIVSYHIHEIAQAHQVLTSVLTVFGTPPNLIVKPVMGELVSLTTLLGRSAELPSHLTAET